MILLHSLRAVNFKQFEDIELRFPEKGAMLIEGNNEAGKSSLFEAVFFALYGETLGELATSDLIRYGAETAETTLEFSVDRRRFRVSRRQGKQQRVTLLVPTSSGDVEEKNGKREVDDLIRRELGMSGAALLNTCFVEQKKLSGLESLNTEKRQATINELVNLTAFSLMEKTLPAKTDDNRAVETAKKRVKVAILDDALPPLMAERDTLRNLHAAACLLSVHTRRGDALQEQTDAEKDHKIVTQLLDLRRRQEGVAQIRAGWLALFHAAETDAQNKNAAVRAAQDAAEELPQLTQRAKDADALAVRLKRGEEIEAEIARRALWEKANSAAVARRDTCADAVTNAKNARANADHALTLAERRDALRQWTDAINVIVEIEDAPPDAEAERLEEAWQAALGRRDELSAAADDAESKANTAAQTAQEIAADRKPKIEALLAAPPSSEVAEAVGESETTPILPSPAPGFALVGVGVALGIAAPLISLPWLIIVALLIAGVGAALLASGARIRRQYEAKQSAAAQERLRQAERTSREIHEGMQALQNQAEAWRTEIKTAETQAHTLRDVAHAARQSIHEANNDAASREMAWHQRAAQTDRSRELPGLRQRVTEAFARLAPSGVASLPQTIREAEEGMAEIESSLVALNLPAGATVPILRSQSVTAKNRLDAAQNEYTAALQAVTNYQPALEYSDDERTSGDDTRRELTEIGLPVVSHELVATLRLLHNVRDNAAQTASELPQCEEAARNAEADCAARRAALFGEIRALTPDGFSQTEGDSAPSDALSRLEDALHQVVQQFGDEGAKRTIAELTERNREITTRLGGLENFLRGLRNEEISPRRALHLPDADAAPLETLLPKLSQTFPEAANRPASEWAERVRQAEDDVLTNRSQRKGQAESLSIPDAALDLPTERERLHNAEFDRARNDAARKILEETRNVILNRVLPKTQQFAQRILPYLTDNRYRELRWVAEEGRVLVKDSRKGDFVAKKVFSGGARDQISLALRLAFALATLPGGKAVRPGWLFLDEPLSSFDEKRTRALVDLLTKGLLGQQFPQIFLVSHSKSFDPERFPHRIEMHEGRILTGGGSLSPAPTTLPL